MSRLNLGCGPELVPDWTCVDRNDHGQADRGAPPGAVCDFMHLPYADCMFEYAVCHHALQQTEYVNLVWTLNEMRRVLIPGGVLRMSVPDVRLAFNAWLQNDPGWFPIVDDAERRIGGKLCAFVTWYSEARSVFTVGWLTELCLRAGYAQVAVCVAGLSFLGGDGITALDARPEESIYVEAQR